MTIIDQDHQRLLQRSVEEDTRIRSAKYFRADGIAMLLEKWSADGVRGSTVVFLTEHVSRMDDAALQEFLKEQGLDLGSAGVTIVRRDEHVFVNYGFEAK
jgi:vacuolar-type H+-ATPase subunit E/Vma4